MARTQACAAECDSNQQVTIDELLRCVAIGLGTLALEACPPCDIAGEDGVGIADLVEGVNVALGDFVVIPAAGQCLKPCGNPCADPRMDAKGWCRAATAWCASPVVTCTANATTRRC